MKKKSSPLPETKAAKEKPAGLAGKRSREDYRQGTIYLPRLMFDDVHNKLSSQNRGKRDKQDFSSVVEQLLADWLQE